MFQEDNLPTVYMKTDLDEEWWIVSLYVLPLVDSFSETSQGYGFSCGHVWM